MRRTKVCWALIATIAVGCDRPLPTDLDTPAITIPLTDVVRVVASESAAVGEHRGVIRALNEIGAPVPSSPLEVQLDGETVSVSFDPLGYGSLSPRRDGLSRVSGVEAPVELHTFSSPWEAPDLHPAWAIPLDAPERMVAAQDGLLATQGGVAWWAGQGAPAHSVLDLGEPIRGLRARHADLDGVLDAVAWTDRRVILLRGRLDGGYGFATAWEADGYTVAGADVRDVTGDQLPDIVIGWSSAEPVLDLWVGDTSLEWLWSSTVRLSDTPVDLVLQDATALGRAQATVLHPDGQAWSRFAVSDDALVAVGPNLPALEQSFGPAPRLLPSGDANADSADEIVLAGSQSVALLDVAVQDDACRLGVQGAQCDPTVSVVSDLELAHPTTGDGNGDRLDDLWYISKDDALRGSFWLSPLGERFAGPVLALPSRGPLAIHDADQDGSVDVGLATNGQLWRWGGRARPNDTVQMWSGRTLARIVTRARIARHVGLYELDGRSNTNEMVILTHENDDTRLKVVQYTHGKGRAAQLGALRLLDEQATPDDFIMCGQSAWFALAGRAWRVDASNPSDLRITGLFGSRVGAVDCIETEDGFYAAYLDGPNVVVFAPSGPQLDPIDAPGAGDVAVGIDEDGPVVRTCEAPCSIAFWPLGDDGQTLFAVSDESGTWLDGRPVGAHRGALTIHDVDGDGRLDLLGLDPVGRRLFVHRSTGASAAPVSLWHTERPVVGRAQVADGTGDGLPDLWTVDAGGEVSFSLTRSAIPEEG